MAGKKRAAKASISGSTTKAATKRAATAAAKKCLQSEKQNKKSAARDDGDKKYHILKLSPIKQDECIALLNAKGVDCGDACDKPHFIGNAFTLKLPLDCQDIADDFVDDYNSDNESTNIGKQSKKPDFVRYHCSPDDENYSYSV
ncbi:MAG: hypothetical protein GY874_16630, partial [Desulfobacteraceae bacterium]|nr:hypothetical protein [Desulfobacteraceae bacterium]